MCIQYILLENGGNSLLITHLLTTSLTTPFSHYCHLKLVSNGIYIVYFFIVYYKFKKFYENKKRKKNYVW
jgi:hypothetical protein